MIHTRLTNACMSGPADVFSVLFLHLLYSNIGPEIQTAQNKNTRIADPSFEKKTLSKVINSIKECTFPSEEINDEKETLHKSDKQYKGVYFSF